MRFPAAALVFAITLLIWAFTWSPAHAAPLAKGDVRVAAPQASGKIENKPPSTAAKPDSKPVSGPGAKSPLKKDDPAKANRSSLTDRKKTAPGAGARRAMMVPPPPPDIPTITGSEQRSFSTIGVPLDYLSLAELTRMRTRLESSVAKLKVDKEEHDRNRRERIERCEQFESLHKEGVVSRRELEAARRELKSLQHDDDDVVLRLEDAITDLSRVNQQIKLLEKRAGKRKL